MYGSQSQYDGSSSANAEWSNTLNTYRDDKTLPTCRLNYISNHPKTKLAKLHTSTDMIAPTWGKISSTVWLVSLRNIPISTKHRSHCFTTDVLYTCRESSSTLYGGYGRRLQVKLALHLFKASMSFLITTFLHR